MPHAEFSVHDLGETAVLDGRRERVRLSTLWEKGTAVLVFVRHFG
jgi:hypothetical protein